MPTQLSEFIQSSTLPLSVTTLVYVLTRHWYPALIHAYSHALIQRYMSQIRIVSDETVLLPVRGTVELWVVHNL